MSEIKVYSAVGFVLAGVIDRLQTLPYSPTNQTYDFHRGILAGAASAVKLMSGNQEASFKDIYNLINNRTRHLNEDTVPTKELLAELTDEICAHLGII